MSLPTPPLRPGRRAALSGLALAVGLLAGCSGGSEASPDAASSSAPASDSPTSASPGPSSEPGGEEAQPGTITATEGDFFLELDSDELAAGSYTIEVVNEGDATHDLVVERDGSDVAASDTIAPGGSTSLTVDLEPGEYVFYCSIGNHRAMGMELTVTVT